jgi:hypothetical protein
LGFDDQSSDALVWVMTAAYLSLAESVGDGEIGADPAGSVIAMLADGIVNQATLSGEAIREGTDNNASRNPIAS